MPLKPCLACGALSRGSYCRRHRPSRVSRGRGSGGRQAAFARAVLERGGGRCQRCGSAERVEAHHVVPLSRGGAQDPDNGVALCRPCHELTFRSLTSAARPD